MLCIQVVLEFDMVVDVELWVLQFGDFGWLIECYGVFYVIEYGLDVCFEVLVVCICVDYVD